MLRSMRAVSVSAFFGGDGVGADEFHLFDEALLLGADEVVVGLRLLDAREALAEGGEAFEAGGEESFLAVEGGGAGRDFFQRLDFGGKWGRLGFEGGDERGNLFLALGLEVDFEGLLDGEHAEVGPGELVEFAAAGVEIEAGGGGLGFGGGGLDVAADGDELGVARAAAGGERGEEGVVLLAEGGELGGGFRIVGGLGAGVDGAAEEREVRNEDEAERVERGAGEEGERVAAGEAEAERQEREPRVVAAGPEDAAVVGRRDHCQWAIADSRCKIGHRDAISAIGGRQSAIPITRR